jgi:hypothetical protein
MTNRWQLTSTAVLRGPHRFGANFGRQALGLFLTFAMAAGKIENPQCRESFQRGQRYLSLTAARRFVNRLHPVETGQRRRT